MASKLTAYHDELRDFWFNSNTPASTIGKVYKISKNAVIGYCTRHFGARSNTIKKEKPKKKTKAIRAKKRIEQIKKIAKKPIMLNVEYLNECGLCKYALGKKQPYEWCKNKATQGAWCDHHYNVVYTKFNKPLRYYMPKSF